MNVAGFNNLSRNLVRRSLESACNPENFGYSWGYYVVEHQIAVEKILFLSYDDEHMIKVVTDGLRADEFVGRIRDLQPVRELRVEEAELYKDLCLARLAEGCGYTSKVGYKPEVEIST